MVAVLDPLREALVATAAIDPGALSRSELGGVVVELRCLLDGLEGEYARLVHHADVERIWADLGFTSLAAWLAKRTGAAHGASNGASTLGEALDKSKELADAVRNGELSPESAKQVAPAVDDDGFDKNAKDLIDEVAHATPTQTGKAVERWRNATDPDAAEERRSRARERRHLTFTPVEDGLERLQGLLPRDVARELRAALESLLESQFNDGSGRTRPQRLADALGDLAAAYNRGDVTGGRNLPHLIVTMTMETFEARAGSARTGTGEPVSSEEIDRLCCDAVIHRLIADQRGVILNFGHGRRTASPQQFMMAVARDGGCRVPGCHRPAHWCHLHHLDEYAARGGETDINRMALLCPTHHHAVHEGRWSVTGTIDHLTFTTHYGTVLHSHLHPPGSTGPPRSAGPPLDEHASPPSSSPPHEQATLDLDAA